MLQFEERHRDFNKPSDLISWAARLLSILYGLHCFEHLANGACAPYFMVSKSQWKPFWLATQRDPQNDWTSTATHNHLNYDIFAQTPLGSFVLRTRCLPMLTVFSGRLDLYCSQIEEVCDNVF